MPALGQSIAIELTETNIKALDATVETNTESSSTPPFSHLQYRHHHHHFQHYSPTHEDPPLHSHRAASPLQTEEPSYQPIEGVVQRRQSKRAVRDREREKRVRRSYAEFCEDFTLSGPAGPRKEYDLTMDMNMDQDLNQDQDDNHNHNHNDDFKIQPPKQLSSPPPRPPSTPQPFQRAGLYNPHQQILTHPSSPTIFEQQQYHPRESPYSDARQDAINAAMWTKPYDSQSLRSQSSSSAARGPRPPSPIITPTVYKEMQRAVQAKKQARKRRMLAPFRALFGSIQPMRKQWFNLDE